MLWNVSFVEWIGNGIRSLGAFVISEAIKINNSLISLDLSGKHCFKLMNDFWYVMSIITKTGNRIEKDGAHLLYDSFQHNTTLTTLNTGC